MNNPEELLQVLGKILRTELVLKEDQTVLYNQPFVMPKDRRGYLSLGILGGRSFAAKTQYKNDSTQAGVLLQEQSLNRQEIISIIFYSKGTEALKRNWEIPVAFNSITAQQAMEANSIKIANLPSSMVDTSQGDGARRLYRYSLTVAVLVAYRKSSNAQFFDSFQSPVITTNS